MSLAEEQVFRRFIAINVRSDRVLLDVVGRMSIVVLDDVVWLRVRDESGKEANHSIRLTDDITYMAVELLDPGDAPARHWIDLLPTTLWTAGATRHTWSHIHA